MQIIEASTEDLQLIRNIATTAWEKTYKEILSPAQSEYMLDMMYSDEALNKQFQNKQKFVLLRDDNTHECFGFVSFEYNYKDSKKTKIHKLYVLPSNHRSGFGKSLIEYVASTACQHGDVSITLNMNRFNRSHGFYTKMGFSIVGEEDINIGNGYLMEDYIFEKKI